MEWFRCPIAGQPCGELIGSFNQPRIARLGGEQDNLTDRNDAPIMLGGPAQNVANFVARLKFLPSTMRWPAPRLIGLRPIPVFAMEIFTKLFGNLLAFVYHCFDPFLSGLLPIR